MKETLGQHLKRRREARFISIQEISHSTGISAFMISALEEDNFHLITQPEMTVKYLKKYAAYVGLDKKDILSRYKTQCERHHQKEYFFPQLSTFSEGDKSSKRVRGLKSLSRKQVIEGVFWMGIVIWALIIIYLYFHVLSLRKIGAHEIQEIIPSKEVSQENSHQRNKPMPSVTSERIGRSFQSSSQGSSRSIAPVPLERDKGTKGVGSQSSNARHLPEKVRVIGNRNSKMYYMPGTKYYHTVTSNNRVIFNSEAEAIKAGYRKGRK